MNKKGFVGIVVIIVILVAIVGTVYVITRPGPSPTGNVISNPSNAINPNNPYNIPEYKNTGKGDYGQECLDDGYCDRGECQAGMCVHCGYFGETCCYNDVAGISCERGSECYLGRCRATEDYTQDCGHVGYKPCYYNEYAKCYYGVYNPSRDICEACGDYEQPCCVDTEYECDYGKCINGICKRVKDQNTGTNPSITSANSNNPNSQDYPVDNHNPSSDVCGDLNQPCCNDINSLSPMGAINARPKCNSGLECYGDVCVNGPEFESYHR